MRNLLVVIAIASLFIQCTRAFAQEDTLSNSGKISSSEVVLTRDDFKRFSCENVGDALKQVAGVFVRNGQIAMRDVAPDKVVILLDGQRLNTAQGGGVDVVTLPIDNVERVEVIRGGNSALYGADAVGGVIKVSTRKATGEQQSAMNVSAHGTIGSFGEAVGNISVSQPVGSLFYLLSYKRTISDGDFDYTTMAGTREKWINNDQSIHDMFAKLSYSLVDGSSLSLSSGYYYADLGAPGLIGQLTPHARLGYRNKNINASFDQAKLFGDFNLKVQAYVLLFSLKYDNPDGMVPQHTTHNNDAYSVDVQQMGSLMDGLGLAYGYTFRQDQLNSTNVGNKMRNNHAAYASLTYTIPKIPFYFDEFSFTPAVRYDYPTDFSQELSPKASLSLRHTGSWKLDLRAHLTRSYRAPTFDDLYWPRDSYAEGNPNLKPELGINYDAGASTTIPVFGEMTFTANYFVNNLQNLILWAPGTDQIWRPENISKSEASGMETAFRWKPFGEFAELGVDYTYMTALDKSNDATTRDMDLIYRPRNKADATLTLRQSGIELTGVNRYVGKRYTNAANTLSLPSYDVVDVIIAYGFKAFRSNFTLKGESSNLGNLDYMIIDGTPIPGRAFRFTLGWTM